MVCFPPLLGDIREEGSWDAIIRLDEIKDRDELVVVQDGVRHFNNCLLSSIVLRKLMLVFMEHDRSQHQSVVSG